MTRSVGFGHSRGPSRLGCRLGCWLGAAGLLASLASCALPWRDYAVSSPISGRLVQQGEAVETGRVRLQVRSVDNAVLGEHEEQSLSAEGAFFFDAVSLDVAGRERSRRYVLLLYWMEGEGEGARSRTLWRADYARAELGGPIELVCRLDRPGIEGPPCRFVGDAKEQPWLLAAGARDFEEHCASCHGASGRGDGPAASDLPRPLPDLRRIAARRQGVFPLDDIAALIDGRTAAGAPVPEHGTREMPIWGVRLADQFVPGRFQDEQIRNRIDILVEYLDSIQIP